MITIIRRETIMKEIRAPRHGVVRIACINKAKTPLGVPFAKLTAALQKCYDEHFLPVWGFPVRLYNTKKAKPTDWQMVYFEDTDDAEALGYHDLTKNGQPVSKIFVKDTLLGGEKVSVTACHELFEMAIDPVANLWAQRGRTSYAYEMCDAVEEDTFLVDGIEMSNFVYPTWFEPFEHRKGTKYDHLGLLKAPFTMTKGGYVIIMRRGRVLEKSGSLAKKARFAREKRWGHRSEHRKTNGKRLGPKYRAWVRANVVKRR